jgi:cell division protein FtsB
LLSLTEVVEEAEMSPKLSSISEDDPRLPISKFYVPPGNFPPLEIHVSRQNGASPLIDPGNSTFTSAAGCRECMFSETQDSSVGIGSSRIAAHEAKKRRRASSGGVQDNLRTKRRAKGKQAQKILPSRSTVVCICFYAHHIHQGADNAIIFEALKNELQALKGRCDSLERTIEDLKSGQDSHENVIEDHRIRIVGLSRHLGTIDTSYQGGELL